MDNIKWVLVAVVFLLLPSAVSASELTEALAKSDDFDRYHAEFELASAELIRTGACRASDFIEIGGWVRSINKQNTYFSYCGGFTADNRVYLDVKTGEVSR